MKCSRLLRAGLALALALAAMPTAGAAARGSQGGGAAARARALVRQMTLDEKISLVHGTGFITGNGYTGFTPAIPRLGIRRSIWPTGPMAWETAPRG